MVLLFLLLILLFGPFRKILKYIFFISLAAKDITWITIIHLILMICGYFDLIRLFSFAFAVLLLVMFQLDTYWFWVVDMTVWSMIVFVNWLFFFGLVIVLETVFVLFLFWGSRAMRFLIRSFSLRFIKLKVAITHFPSKILFTSIIRVLIFIIILIHIFHWVYLWKYRIIWLAFSFPMLDVHIFIYTRFLYDVQFCLKLFENLFFIMSELCN